ncbi:MAG: hypothetical protein ACIAS6_11395 [Phycisphaerales bacterium JB060]
MQAVAAREYLVQNGVPAEVVGGNSDGMNSWGFGRSSGSYEVVLGSKSDGELATYLLEEWDREPMEMEGELDDHAAPDLSVLDASMAPKCPACNEYLPLVASLEDCPACGATVDVAALIVKEHGPEALHECYDATPSVEELAEMDAKPSACPACGGPIGDRGVCGWCGRRG